MKGVQVVVFPSHLFFMGILEENSHPGGCMEINS